MVMYPFSSNTHGSGATVKLRTSTLVAAYMREANIKDAISVVWHLDMITTKP
jgi:hypothetical protein